MKKTVDFISVAAFIFIVCLVGAWDSGYITAMSAVCGVVFTIPFVIVSGFICSLISSIYKTQQRRYTQKVYR